MMDSNRLTSIITSTVKGLQYQEKTKTGYKMKVSCIIQRKKSLVQKLIQSLQVKMKMKSKAR